MTRSDLIFYKNYYGSVHFDPQEELFFGKIEFIRDLVNYEATEAKSLVKAFHEVVDSYLENCNNLAKTPDKPFKGSFNVRVDPEMRKQDLIKMLIAEKTRLQGSNIEFTKASCQFMIDSYI